MRLTNGEKGVPYPLLKGREKEEEIFGTFRFPPLAG